MINVSKLKFYKEQIDKDNRNIQLFTTYAPPSKLETLTGKFYARHENLTDVEPPEEYIKLIEKKKFLKPRDLYDYKPPTCNMEYGFFTENLIPQSTDERLWFPRRSADFIKNELKIRYSNQGIPTETFTGTPFRV